MTAPCGPVPVTVSTSRVYAEEAQTRHQVTATAIEDATIVVQPYSFSFTARATWSAAGRDHSDIVMWSDHVKAGDQQLIWVNAEGVHVRPPSSPSRAGGDAVGIALSVWFGVAGASAGLVYVVRRRLDRRRYAQWDGEMNASRDNGGRADHK